MPTFKFRPEYVEARLFDPINDRTHAEDVAEWWGNGSLTINADSDLVNSLDEPLAHAGDYVVKSGGYWGVYSADDFAAAFEAA